MACNMDERIVKNLATPNLHGSHLGIDIGTQLSVAKLHQIGQRGRVGIPIAAPFVFEQGNLDILCIYSQHSKNKSNGQYNSFHGAQR